MDDFEIKPPVADYVCQIEWAVPGKHARRVVKRSNVRVTEKYPSWKVPEGKMLQSESSLETVALILFDVNPSVLRIRTQPALIHYALFGQPKVHFPDIYIETARDRSFIEVKPRKKTKEAEFKERTAYLTPALATQGYGYSVLTEDDLFREPMLSNAKFLLRYGQQPVPLLEKELIRQAVSMTGFLTWGDILAGAFGTYSVARICRLILEGALTIDMHSDWIGDTKVKFATLQA